MLEFEKRNIEEIEEKLKKEIMFLSQVLKINNILCIPKCSFHRATNSWKMKSITQTQS